MPDHNKILRCLKDNGPSTEEQILDCKLLSTQADRLARVELSLPRMVANGLITVDKSVVPVYTITKAGLDYLALHS